MIDRALANWIRPFRTTASADITVFYQTQVPIVKGFGTRRSILTVRHLNYATFRRRGIPRGSGAIESTIRRVNNQRLKSNAMYWLQENAEAMFAVRATMLCDRWEETLKRVRHTMAHDRRLNWRWDAPDTSSKLNANITVQPPQLQHFTTQQPTAIAA